MRPTMNSPGRRWQRVNILKSHRNSVKVVKRCACRVEWFVGLVVYPGKDRDFSRRKAKNMFSKWSSNRTLQKSVEGKRCSKCSSPPYSSTFQRSLIKSKRTSFVFPSDVSIAVEQTNTPIFRQKRTSVSLFKRNKADTTSFSMPTKSVPQIWKREAHVLEA